MAHHSAFSFVLTVSFLGMALVHVSAISPAADQPSATIVAIAGATITYHSINRHEKVVTVQVPSQSAADIRGADAQGQVQTPAGQTMVLPMSPAALRRVQIGDSFTLTVPAPSR